MNRDGIAGKDEQGRERQRPDDRRNGSLSDHDGDDRRKPEPQEKAQPQPGP